MATLYEQLCEFSAAQPDAFEDHPWGEVVFKIRGKIFVSLGCEEATEATVKARPEDAEGLLAFPFIRRAAYVGRYGWVTLRIEDEAALEMARDLIADSYALVAKPARKPRRSAG